MTIIYCHYCNKQFTPVRNDKRIKYCSKKCREIHWRENNPDKTKAHGKNGWQVYRVRHKVHCRNCNKAIPLEIRKSGLVFCSTYCRNEKRKADQTRHRREKFEEYQKYKEEKGCQICGYNKHFGSLDFHHIDPSEKEIRITATHFVGHTDKIEKELKKCILVCKNCHYELHHLLRNNLEKYWEIMEINNKKENLL